MKVRALLRTRCGCERIMEIPGLVLEWRVPLRRRLSFASLPTAPERIEQDTRTFEIYTSYRDPHYGPSAIYVEKE